jgi:hypothetical protein
MLASGTTTVVPVPTRRKEKDKEMRMRESIFIYLLHIQKFKVKKLPLKSTQILRRF